MYLLFNYLIIYLNRIESILIFKLHLIKDYFIQYQMYIFNIKVLEQYYRKKYLINSFQLSNKYDEKTIEKF